MSGIYPIILKKRALSALKWAERAFEENDYDVTAREAEYAVQLYVKSLIYRVLGEEVRGHNIRELLGILASVLFEENFENEARTILDYVRKHRRELAELSDAHTRATYGLFEYGKREAELLLRIAKDIINKLKELEVKIFGERV